MTPQVGVLSDLDEALVADKQRLLAIVETAFGTLNDFNHSVRSALSLVKVVRRSIDIITGKSALDP